MSECDDTIIALQRAAVGIEAEGHNASGTMGMAIARIKRDGERIAKLEAALRDVVAEKARVDDVNTGRPSTYLEGFVMPNSVVEVLGDE